MEALFVLVCLHEDGFNELRGFGFTGLPFFRRTLFHFDERAREKKEDRIG